MASTTVCRRMQFAGKSTHNAIPLTACDTIQKKPTNRTGVSRLILQQLCANGVFTPFAPFQADPG